MKPQVLITRPSSQAKMLSEKIRAIGWEPIIFPAIDIIDPPESVKIDQLNHANKIIFISPIAVQKLSEHIKKLPPAAELFAIGKGSADTLKEKFFKTAIYPQNQFNSAGLLALSHFQFIPNQKIVLCQGKGGNPLLYQTLTARGAHVIQLWLYQRVLPKNTALPSLKNIRVVICTSAEILQNLITLFGEKIMDKTLLLSSEPLKKLATTLGFQQLPILSKNASDEALVEKLKNISIH